MNAKITKLKATSVKAERKEGGVTLEIASFLGVPATCYHKVSWKEIEPIPRTDLSQIPLLLFTKTQCWKMVYVYLEHTIFND